MSHNSSRRNGPSYTDVTGPLPPASLRWNVYGAGLANVGRNDSPEPEPIRLPRSNEVFVRHDACGICYSDIKILALGGAHPRLAGRDLRVDPIVIGHEVSLTVVAVGEGYRDRFRPGERYIVQADIFYQGKGIAYGYRIQGGMSQYAWIGPEVIDGDEGCYLLPIADATGYVAGALVEPWACVEAAYHWSKPGDRTDAFVALTDRMDADDFEAATADMPKDALVAVDISHALSRSVAIDVGRIHYDGHRYIGPRSNEREELKSGGTAWFLGAAGPMGQMHVQRALQLAEPPACIVATDISAERLAAMESRFRALAAERGISLTLLNVSGGDHEVEALAPQGFDDIVVLIPSASAIERAFPLLADGGVLNVFAGIQRGITARLPIWEVATRNVRIVGTTGSSLADMVLTRDRMESGQLDTAASLAAIGGLDALKDGLQAVRDGRFPGKTVIFPQIRDLPLTALTDLEAVRPDVYNALREGRYWTRAAEDALLGEGH